MRRPVLAAVEHVDIDEIAEAALRVELLCAPCGKQPARHRHVLVERVIGVRAAREEQLARLAVHRAVARVVVVDLVIVGRRPARRRRHARLARFGVGLVERVTRAIVVERVRLGRVVRPHARDAAILVDVVADVHDEVGASRDDRAISGEVAVLVVLAARDRERADASGSVPRAGAVRVRPIGLRCPPLVKRYQ